ncbi:hypothetical protein RQP46_009898 [Phenoliferia psychrophenolica]
MPQLPHQDDTVSISSTSVAGSLTAPDPDSPSLTESASASPLSSPIIDAVLVDPTPSQPLLRGPLDSLRAQDARPTRSGSNKSVSSLLVETGSTASTEDGGSVKDDGRDESVLPTVVGGSPQEDHDDEPATPTTSTSADREEQMRQAQTQLELDQYEREESDPTVSASPAAPSVALPLSTIPDVATLPDVAPAAAASGMPQVKCSDCGGMIDLMELADHSCLPPSQTSPALLSLSSAPSSPQISFSPSAPTRPITPPAQQSGYNPSYQPIPFRTSPASTFSRPSPTTSRPPSTHSISIPPTTPIMNRSQSTTSATSSSSNNRFAQKLDSFVSHPTTLIPTDVYSDSDSSSADPYDLDDLMPDSPTVPNPMGSPNLPGVGRTSPRSSFDLPQGIEEGAFDEPGLERRRGEEGERRGRWADIGDDDEGEGYEGGVATIVRTTASHRSPSSSS